MAVFGEDGAEGYLLTWHRTLCPQAGREVRRGIGVLLTAQEGMLLPRTGILFTVGYCRCLRGKWREKLANLAAGVDNWETVADNGEGLDW